MRVRPVFVANIAGLSLLLWAAHLATLKPTPIHGDYFLILGGWAAIGVEYCVTGDPDPRVPAMPPWNGAAFQVAADDVPLCIKVLSDTGNLLNRWCSAVRPCPSGLPSFEICPFEPPTYRINVRSETSGDCYDGADLLVDQDGHRVDDGPGERILWRMGRSGQFCLLMSATLTLSPVLRAARRRWKKKAPPPAKPRRPAVAFVLRWLPSVGLFVAAANILRAL